MDDQCHRFSPWNQYDNSLVKISECSMWTGDRCELNEPNVPNPCPMPWVKNNSEKT